MIHNMRFPEFPLPPQHNDVEVITNYLSVLHAELTDYLQYLTRDLQTHGKNMELDDLKNTDLSDPDADRIVFWDDSDGQFEFLIPGTALAIAVNTMSWSWLGLEALTDPGADRIYFWDETANASKWLAPDGTTIEISGTTLRAIASGIDTVYDGGSASVLTGEARLGINGGTSGSI